MGRWQMFGLSFHHVVKNLISLLPFLLCVSKYSLSGHRNIGQSGWSQAAQH